MAYFGTKQARDRPQLLQQVSKTTSFCKSVQYIVPSNCADPHLGKNPGHYLNLFQHRMPKLTSNASHLLTSNYISIPVHAPFSLIDWIKDIRMDRILEVFHCLHIND